MPIQPVKNSIEIHRLPTLLQPLNHTHNMITPVTHAHQLVNQLTVRMVANKLLRASTPDHKSVTAWGRRSWKRRIYRRIATLRVVGGWRRVMRSGPFIVV